MGRLPLGSVSPYVKTSSGGSMDPMKFYCTSYGAAYGKTLTNIEKNLFSSVNLTTRIWTLLFTLDCKNVQYTICPDEKLHINNCGTWAEKKGQIWDSLGFVLKNVNNMFGNYIKKYTELTAKYIFLL